MPDKLTIYVHPNLDIVACAKLLAKMAIIFDLPFTCIRKTEEFEQYYLFL